MTTSLVQRSDSKKLYRTTEESTEPEESPIIGTLPSYIKGVFLRNGPGYYPDTGRHLLDGYSLISKFTIGDNKIKFEKKYLKSDAFTQFMKNGISCFCEFATPKLMNDPSRGWMSRIYNSIVPEFTDNANISLFNLGENVFVAGETCHFYDLNMSTLSHAHKFDTNKIFGLHVTTPHPITDYRTGVTYNIGSSYAPTLKYSVIKIPPAQDTKDPKQVLKKSKALCSIPSRWKRNVLSYNHSFGLTENYIVFIEQPYVVSLNKILSSVISKGQSFRDWVEWHAQDSTNRFYIIEKETGKVLNLEIMSQDAFFFLHIINCYEENGQIVVTLSSYDDPTVLDTQFLETLREGGTEGEETRAAGHQYVIPINVKNIKDCPEDQNLCNIPFSKAIAYRKGPQIVVIPEILTERGIEFPTINKSYIGFKNQYYYGSGLTGQFRNSLVKVDLASKSISYFKESSNHLIGEPVFIPDPSGESEDNGVLICPVTDCRHDAYDFILFIDAKSMKEIARTFFPHIPLSLHGIFVPTV